jgi:hypothetical protein
LQSREEYPDSPRVRAVFGPGHQRIVVDWRNDSGSPAYARAFIASFEPLLRAAEGLLALRLGQKARFIVRAAAVGCPYLAPLPENRLWVEGSEGPISFWQGGSGAVRYEHGPIPAEYAQGVAAWHAWAERVATGLLDQYSRTYKAAVDEAQRGGPAFELVRTYPPEDTTP